MSMATLARRAIKRALRLERRTLGISQLIPVRVRRLLRHAIGMGPPGEGRRFIPAHKLQQLFETLNERHANYVVLRWFEFLPDQVDGDIDFLIADEALTTFECLLGFDKDGIPCDLYSESGHRGFRYAGMPYLPVPLARRILSRRMLNEQQISVPCPEDHFLSLAYHAVYQKGLQSGLRTSLPDLQPEFSPKHDYHGTLARLAESLQVRVDISMEGLDEVLSNHGWRPTTPILRRLAHDNVWIQRYFEAELEHGLRSRFAFKLPGHPPSGGQHAGA